MRAAFRGKTLTPEIVSAITENIRLEVEQYDQFATGDVYGYVLKNEDDIETGESCWGFYGIEDARQEARAAAKCEARRILGSVVKVAREERKVEKMIREGFAL